MIDLSKLDIGDIVEDGYGFLYSCYKNDFSPIPSDEKFYIWVKSLSPIYNLLSTFTINGELCHNGSSIGHDKHDKKRNIVKVVKSRRIDTSITTRSLPYCPVKIGDIIIDNKTKKEHIITCLGLFGFTTNMVENKSISGFYELNDLELTWSLLTKNVITPTNKKLSEREIAIQKLKERKIQKWYKNVT